MLKVYLSPTKRHAVLSRHGFCCFLGLDKFFAPILALSMPILNGKTTLKNPFTHAKRTMQAGFSLLEMLVVIGLLGILAMGTTTLLIDDGDWKRQDETEKKWDAIRKAIIGEPNLSLNGSPYVAGYVADMGRLPVSVAELMDRHVTFDDDNNPNTPEVDRPFNHDGNAATANIVVNQPAWTEVIIYRQTAVSDCAVNPDECYTLAGGWRGPYLYAAGSQVYRDGWNNEDGNVNDDFFNFGWLITFTGVFPTVNQISIHSLGFDNQLGGQEASRDFPSDINQPMIALNEWTLGAEPITFNINFNKAVSATSTPITLPPLGIDGLPQELELRIYRYIDNGNAVADLANDILEESADTTFTIEEGNRFSPAQTLTPSINLPIGRFAAVIWCVNNTPASGAAPAGADAVFDGNCDSTFNHAPVYFTLTHSTSQVTLTWNLP